ncbi:MAG: AraC family transcriptional regulator [Muribaculaceae bacterium]|nr:AraC family transcriptional regulator [Muribaculaceae bacterium]
MDHFILHLRDFCYGGLIAFFLATIVKLVPAFRKQRNRNGRFLMQILALTMVLLTIKYIIHFALDAQLLIHPGTVSPATYSIVTIMEMMAVPLMGVSLMSIVRIKPTGFAEVILELIPLIICFIALIFTQDTIVEKMAGWYVLIYSVLVIIYVHFASRKYHAILNETYANTGNRGVSWVLTTLYFLVGLVVIWYVLRYLFPSQRDDIIFSVLSLVPWIFYSHRLLRHDFTTTEMMVAIAKQNEENAEEDNDNEASAVKTWQEAKFGDAIRAFCTEEKNFTNTELSIVDVARAVGSNRTYVSRWFKEQGVNFSTFIAHIRLDRAEHLLLNTDISITEIVSLAGFSTPRTFRAAFIARHQCTPSEFRQRNLQPQ